MEVDAVPSWMNWEQILPQVAVEASHPVEGDDCVVDTGSGSTLLINY